MSSYFSTTPSYFYNHHVVSSPVTTAEEKSSVELPVDPMVVEPSKPVQTVEPKPLVQKSVVPKQSNIWADSFYATPDFASSNARPLGFKGDGPIAPTVDIQKMRDQMIEKANRARAEYDELMVKLKELEKKINGHQKTVHYEEKVEDEKSEVKQVEEKLSVQPVINQTASVYFGLPNDCVHFYNRQPEYHLAPQATKNYDFVEAKICESSATATDFEDQGVSPNTPICYDSSTSVYHFDSLRDQYNAYENVQF
ncbi:hypothetical protein M3Y98_00341500 [Aphelenchoides besseyi]|nr:hypothetical protein M3Y98_00341500 [Aphelenchoides besseyi]KAI6194364.1 hypothetical protein M3Y96_01117000 [Aphelenchoides besseyi]